MAFIPRVLTVVVSAAGLFVSGCVYMPVPLPRAEDACNTFVPAWGIGLWGSEDDLPDDVVVEGMDQHGESMPFRLYACGDPSIVCNLFYVVPAVTLAASTAVAFLGNAVHGVEMAARCSDVLGPERGSGGGHKEPATIMTPEEYEQYRKSHPDAPVAFPG